MEEQDKDNTTENNLDQEASDVLLEQSEEVEDTGTCNQSPTLVNSMEASDELLMEPMTNSPRRKYGRTILLGGIIVVAMIVGSLAVLKCTTYMTAGSLPKNAEELFDAEVSPEEMLVTEFMTSRRLAQTMAVNFKPMCAPSEPVCNPEVAFASEMQKFLHAMKKDAPQVYRILAENKLPGVQQELIMRVLPLANNKKVLELGQLYVETRKRWEKFGPKVVHEKVKEALDEYLQLNGAEGIPSFGNPSQPTPRNASLQSRVEPYLHGFMGGNGSERRLYYRGNGVAALLAGGVGTAVSIGALSIIGLSYLFPFLWLLFEILDYNGVMHLGYALKIAVIWWEGFYSSITCLTIAACPFEFLLYWLHMWLNFGHYPSKIKGLPWDFLMRKIPGLNHPDEPGWHIHSKGPRSLAADPRIAA